MFSELINISYCKEQINIVKKSDNKSEVEEYLKKQKERLRVANLLIENENKFSGLSYSDKLRFWDECNLEPLCSQYNIIKKENGKTKTFSIYPKTEAEYNDYFNYHFTYLKSSFPLDYDLEKMKEHYLSVIDENPNSIYFAKEEFEKYKSVFEGHLKDAKLKGSRSQSYKIGFESIAKKERINFVKTPNVFENLLMIATGKIHADFIPFLEEQLVILEEEKKNPKKENSEIDTEILEVRTKLILLNELGIIKHLQGFEPFKNANELCKFLAEIIETKEENKKKTFETLRTDLRYIDFTKKKNKKSPNTSTALRKVNSTLSKFALPTINE